MKILFLTILLSFKLVSSQPKEVIVCLPITDYVVVTDSVCIVQVKASPELQLKRKQIALIQRIENNEWVTIGTGKCYLIKGDYYYFAYKKDKYPKTAEFGDLLFTMVTRDSFYESIPYALQKYNIKLTSIFDEPFYYDTEFLTMNEDREKELLNLFLYDIQYTAEEMVKQEDSQSKIIEEVKFKGKDIFQAMKESDVNDLRNFFDFVNYNSTVYANQTFKISEIYATWLSRGFAK